jgi:hypothetical protein
VTLLDRNPVGAEDRLSIFIAPQLAYATDAGGHAFLARAQQRLIAEQPGGADRGQKRHSARAGRLTPSGRARIAKMPAASDSRPETTLSNPSDGSAARMATNAEPQSTTVVPIAARTAGEPDVEVIENRLPAMAASLG